MRGIEARRHDMPPWSVETQRKALKCLSLADDVRDLPKYLREAFSVFKQALDDLNAGKVPLKELVVTMRISRELEAYRAPTPSVRAAQQLLDRTGVALGYPFPAGKKKQGNTQILPSMSSTKEK